jgi:hypothetical protein
MFASTSSGSTLPTCVMNAVGLSAGFLCLKARVTPPLFERLKDHVLERRSRFVAEHLWAAPASGGRFIGHYFIPSFSAPSRLGGFGS